MINVGFGSKHWMRLIEENNSVLEEKLTLTKKTLEDGKIIFVVDSDLEGRDAGNETYKNKDKIKETGLFYFDRTNLRKWISKAYTQEEFLTNLPKFKRALAVINREDMGSFDGMLDDLAEVTALGMKDKMTGFLKDLKEMVRHDAGSPEVQAFLQFSKKFRSYSFNNTMLIYIQKRDATRVAGKTKWFKSFGRKLKKGATPIYIYVPMNKKENPEEPSTDKSAHVDETKYHTAFILKPVYDISDTEVIEGKEHLNAGMEEPKWFDDAPVDEKTQVIYDALTSLAKKENIRVTVGGELGGARGSSSVGNIKLMVENISTFIHELAHEFIHDMEVRKKREIAKNIMELQAEGVAYVVLREFELPAGHASKYLALWKIEPENITENQAIIQKTANYIIDYIYTFQAEGEEVANTEISRV
jgi:hypothetical protein